MQHDFSSSLPWVTYLAFALHVGGGTIGLVAGTIAIFAAKGGNVHRAAGNIFFGSMLVMAVFAVYLGFAMPGQIVNVFIGTFAFYLVATGWLTVQRPEGAIGHWEKIALAIIAVLLLPFGVLIFQTLSGITVFKSAFAIKGPILIALYSFSAVIAICAICDAKVVFAGGISGAPRIARHLWRMCLGLTMATGSAFTNGFPRLFPGPMHVTTFDFLPQFVPLILMVFWLIRVRFTGWYRKNDTASVSPIPT